MRLDTRISENGAKFQEDIYFGSSEFKLAFAEEGLEALCYKLGFPLLALVITPKKNELASKIINGLLIYTPLEN
jgi:hypothetical protein